VTACRLSFTARETPLLVSAMHGNNDAIECLLRFCFRFSKFDRQSLGADLLKKNAHGMTALYLASRQGYQQCAEYLKGMGLSFSEESSDEIKFSIR
jgi:ankyrin repeat protein